MTYKTCQNDKNDKSKKRISNMDIVQRRARLEKTILQRQEISISELGTMFDVSGVTLRNDLIFLERQGVCRRLFGRVVAEDGSTGLQVNYTHQKNLMEKERIGKYAASLISEGESVLFFFGTTTQQVARFVDSNLKFIAITNSIHIAQELRSLRYAKVLFLGGMFNPALGATYGYEAIQQVTQYKIDKLFLSVNGIDAQAGITNDLPFETDIHRVIMNLSRKIIVVADNTKIGNVSFVCMGEIKDVDMLITDSGADTQKVEELREKGLEVIIV